MKRFILFITMIFAFSNVLVYANTEAELLRKIIASDRASDDRFGTSVAISGNYAVVGAFFEDHDANGNNLLSNAGSAYIFELVNGSWTQVEKIVASDRTADDRFGASVAISGNYIVVGALNQDTDEDGLNSLSNAGAIYVFERDNGNWTEVKKLVASDRSAGDNFGYSVSIDGNNILVGAYNQDTDKNGGNSLSDAGAAYVFERALGVWSQKEKIVASDRVSNDYFGASVNIKGDYLIVGAWGQDTDASQQNFLTLAGAAYVFKLVAGDWTEQKKLVTNERVMDNYFGTSVGINSNYAFVATTSERRDANGLNSLSYAGAVYIFENNSDNWTQYQKIVPSIRRANDQFGYSISNSGNYLLIGSLGNAYDENDQNQINGAGASFIFSLDGNDDWVETLKFVAHDRSSSDQFGTSVSISNRNIIVGAPGDYQDENNQNPIFLAGSSYIYSLADSPEVSNISLVSSFNSSATLTSNVTVNGSSTTVTYESGTTTGNYSSTSTATVLSEDDAVQVVLGSLVDGQEYFVRVRVENSVSATFSSEFSFTYQNVPQSHSSTFTLARNEITQLVFNIESLTSVAADGYIILYKLGSSFTGVPADGGNYSVGTAIGDATVGAIITDANALEATVANLTKQTEYHFKIYPFNWDGSDITTAAYKTDGTVPSLTVVTVPTLGEWGMIAFVGFMAIGGFVYMRRRIV